MGQIIRLIDSNTKENVNYEEVTMWHDGTVMDDSKVDNIIYRKKLNKYYRRKELSSVLPEWFGAIGDGITDDSDAIIKCASVINILNIPNVEFNNKYLISKDITLHCSIKGYGTIYTSDGALVKVQKSYATVENIKIIGRNNEDSIGRGLYFAYGSVNTARNVTVVGVNGAGITFQTCHDSIAYGCYCEDLRGTFGDGIIFMDSRFSKAFFNTCKSYQRVGIVFDWSGENASEDIIAIGNTCEDAVESLGEQINAGIWAEKCKGGIIANNIVRNNIAKGIVYTPAVSETNESYVYTLSGNTIENSNEGFNFIYAENQILRSSGNTFNNIVSPVELSKFKLATFANDVFNGDSTNPIFRIAFELSAAKRGTLTIENCKNYTGGYAINIQDIYGMYGHINVYDCAGNWALRVLANDLSGTVTYRNTLIDYTVFSNTSNIYLNNFRAIYDNCEIKVRPMQSGYLITQGSVTYKNGTTLTGSEQTSIYIGPYGSSTIQIFDSILRNISYTHQENQLNLSIKNSRIENYTANGFVVGGTPINSLELVNNTLINNANGAFLMNRSITSVIENNNYAPKGLGFERGYVKTTANRPALNLKAGDSVFDKTINKLIIYNGTAWIDAMGNNV